MRTRRMWQLILFMLAVNSSVVSYGQACNNSTLRGLYHYGTAGSLVSGSSVVALAELGKIVADGQGNFTGSATANAGGAIQTSTLSGTYSISSDCSGSLSLRVNSLAPVPVLIQLERGGKSAVLAVSSTAEVVVGRLRRQSPSGSPPSCTAASFSGSYAFLTSGVVTVGNQSFAISIAGRLTATAPNVLTSATATNFSGNVAQTSGSGTFSIGADCSGTAQLGSATGSTSFNFAIVGWCLNPS